MAEQWKMVFQPQEEKEKNAFQNQAVQNIPRIPFPCPIWGCNRNVTGTMALTHYLTAHFAHDPKMISEVVGRQKTVLRCDPKILPFQQNICLGMILYGGTSNDPKTLPVRRGVCLKNNFLPNYQERFNSHLPVLVMVCMTNWPVFLVDKSQIDLSEPVDINKRILIIWLVTVPLAQPVHCTAAVLNQKVPHLGQSVTMKIRQMNQPQNPSEFVNQDPNFLLISHDNIRKLTMNYQSDIEMEVFIEE